jgi:hypothetical protein
MSEDRRIPEWLAPYKNEWRSMSTLNALFTTEGRPMSPWLREIQPRLRCMRRPIPGPQGFGKYYLVKQVWAFALAHGVTLVPSSVLTGEAEKMERLEKRIKDLELSLYLATTKPPVVRIVRPPDWTQMLAAMLCATEPRPLPGVYFLISEGVVTYVGQSQNVLARMSGHTGKTFDTVKMIHTPDPTARLVEEGRWIGAFSPRDNIAGKIAA